MEARTGNWREPLLSVVTANRAEKEKRGRVAEVLAKRAREVEATRREGVEVEADTLGGMPEEIVADEAAEAALPGAAELWAKVQGGAPLDVREARKLAAVVGQVREQLESLGALEAWDGGIGAGAGAGAGAGGLAGAGPGAAAEDWGQTLQVYAGFLLFGFCCSTWTGVDPLAGLHWDVTHAAEGAALALPPLAVFFWKVLSEERRGEESKTLGRRRGTTDGSSGQRDSGDEDGVVEGGERKLLDELERSLQELTGEETEEEARGKADALRILRESKATAGIAEADKASGGADDDDDDDDDDEDDGIMYLIRELGSLEADSTMGVIAGLDLPRAVVLALVAALCEQAVFIGAGQGSLLWALGGDPSVYDPSTSLLGAAIARWGGGSGAAADDALPSVAELLRPRADTDLDLLGPRFSAFNVGIGALMGRWTPGFKTMLTSALSASGIGAISGSLAYLLGAATNPLSNSTAAAVRIKVELTDEGTLTQTAVPLDAKGRRQVRRRVKAAYRKRRVEAFSAAASVTYLAAAWCLTRNLLTPVSIEFLYNATTFAFLLDRQERGQGAGRAAEEAGEPGPFADKPFRSGKPDEWEAHTPDVDDLDAARDALLRLSGEEAISEWAAAKSALLDAYEAKFSGRGEASADEENGRDALSGPPAPKGDRYDLPIQDRLVTIEERLLALCPGDE